MKQWLLVTILFLGSSTLSLKAFALSFGYYPQWPPEDRLYYSPFNEGEQWIPPKRFQKKFLHALKKLREDIPYPIRIKKCHLSGGTWNYFTDTCAFPSEQVLARYLAALEAERLAETAPPSTLVEPSTPPTPIPLDWEHFEAWPPSLKLKFSPFATLPDPPKSPKNPSP